MNTAPRTEFPIGRLTKSAYQLNFVCLHLYTIFFFYFFPRAFENNLREERGSATAVDKISSFSTWYTEGCLFNCAHRSVNIDDPRNRRLRFVGYGMLLGYKRMAGDRWQHRSTISSAIRSPRRRWVEYSKLVPYCCWIAIPTQLCSYSAALRGSRSDPRVTVYIYQVGCDTRSPGHIHLTFLFGVCVCVYIFRYYLSASRAARWHLKLRSHSLPSPTWIGKLTETSGRCMVDIFLPLDKY